MRLRKNIGQFLKWNRTHIYFFEPEVYKGKWKNVFGNENPIHLEIGSGKGSFIAKMSKREPNINFIGIEMETNAFAYATRKNC